LDPRHELVVGLVELLDEAVLEALAGVDRGVELVE
jgi:hypothetical protein